MRPRDPLLALTTAAGLVLAVGAVWRLGWTWDLPAYLYLAAVTVPLTVIDLREHRLPNALTLSAYPATAVLLAVPAALGAEWSTYGQAMLGGGALLAVYAALHLVNPAGMGLGDVKLAGPLGALLAWLSWSHVLVGTLVGFVGAAVVGVALMMAGRATRRSALPFGPFMLAGAWAAILTIAPAG